MEQRLAALFASVMNSLDPQVYTYSDSDYLVRKALVKFLTDENALVASARKISDPEEVVESVLNYVVSTDFATEDPADWYKKAARIVVEFADFAYNNEITEDSSRYSALLPDGHPRGLRVVPMTAAARRSALAEWMAADSRLDEEASAQVYRLYSMGEEVDDLEAEFETMKAEAMVAAGKMPEDLLPIVAAFNLSFAQRSAISKALAAVRRRDRKGRFAREFGRLKLFFKSRGQFFSSSPRIVGPGRSENTYQVESKGDPNIPDGIYEVDAALGENIKAYLPKSLVKGLATRKEVVAEEDKRFAIELDDFLKTKQDVPNNWTKSGNKFVTKDGKFTATKIDSDEAQKFLDKAQERGDDTIVSGTGAADAFDPENPEAFLVSDNKGRTKGVAQDWAGIQEIAIANGGTLEGPSGDLPVGSRTVSDLRKLEEQMKLPIVSQNVTDSTDKSKLSPSMIGEGYNFSKDGENSWRKDDHGPDGETYTVERGSNGKWIVGEISGSDPFPESRDLEVFDNPLEAFEYANDLGSRPSEWDQDWVDELMSEGGPDLDQNVAPKNKLDAADFSAEDLESSQKYIDSLNQAVFNNDRASLNDTISRAANDANISDEAYSALLKARDARDAREYEVENALADGSREDIEALLENPEYAGWSNRLEEALGVDLDQDAPVLSEKQQEAASGKQYAFLGEFLEERQLDPATEQAFKDAIENKNLNKAQASSLIALGRSADFKPGVDPNKPSERMLNSLQGYLSSKDLAPSEIKEVLDSLQKDGSRNNVDALLNKLRRKKDKPIDLNQGAGSLTRHSDGSYEWEDVYNNVNVNKTPNGWEVEYTSPDLEDDGAFNWSNRIFNSEDEALAFAEDLIKQNQDDGGYARAADNLMSTADLDQEAKGTLADAATDKQWDFLQSLLDGKKIDNAELEAAVRSALADRNLTKGEVGAFIGQLRPLEDKPNVRREPSAKQIASIKRALLERDLTPEGRKELEDKLAAGLSFDEASELLNDLKKRPITLDGMTRLLDKLALDQDMDTMRYLLDKPEYAEYYDAIRDTMRQLAIDTDDPRFQDLIDARDSVDLDQNVTGRRYGNDWNLDPDVLSPEDQSKYSREISDVNLALNIGHEPTVRDLREKYSNDSSLPENVRAELLYSINTWLEYDAEVSNALESIWNDDEDSDSAKRNIDLFIGNAAYRPWWPLLADDSGRYNIVQSQEEYDQVMDDLGLDLKDAMDRDVDLDQNVTPRSIGTKDIADRLSKELDALDLVGVSQNTISDEYKEFSETDNAGIASDIVNEMRDLANSRDISPELSKSINELADRMESDLIDRFGFGVAARHEDGSIGFYLDEIYDKVEIERELYFETDVDAIVEKLDDTGSYGDSRSGGAEARVSENEDGTFTATVQYDRSRDEMTFEDRDEALAWAANEAADYNLDVRPGSYRPEEIDSLVEDGDNARTPEQALDVADRIDRLVKDLRENRGDRDLANDLEDYADRLRGLVAKKQAAAEAEVPDEPTTPETMDEMATDPELNPAGYAESVGSDLFDQFDRNELVDPVGGGAEKPSDGTYTSKDGRVSVDIDSDNERSAYSVKVDGQTIGSGNFNFSDELASEIQKLVQEHFSKKA